MKSQRGWDALSISVVLRAVQVGTLVMACWACATASATGTWIALANRAPDAVNTMLLLPDGAVMACDANDLMTWYRLTPDIHGSYTKGTWTTLSAMHDSRLYYASDVLTNGRVFVAGGEYGSGASSGEIYDPLLDSWTMISAGAGQSYVDMISVVLPDSTILCAPVQPGQSGQTAIYDPRTDSWPQFPQLFNGYNQDEASWVMLPDNSILTDDPYSTNTERFIPALNQWVGDAALPAALFDTNLFEIGPFLLLANSNALCIGNSGNTAIYTPSGDATPGSWVAGPNEPPGLGAPDAPAAMLTDGNVLCAFGPTTNYTAPTSFFEYDAASNDFVAVESPGSFTNDNPPYVMRMLDLPDGGVLLSYSDSRLYEYLPSGAPVAAGQPAITSITTNFYGSYHLTGTLLNGISQGAAYGDDAQMNSNYPLIRMTNAQGLVYYARAYNWSSTAVMTGSLPVTTDFMVPRNLPAGNYALVVVANGISSAPFSFAFAPDALQLSSLKGFSAAGPFGGPVAGQSTNYTLTNAGSSSLDWSVGNIPSWLNVWPTNGTLSGGSTAMVAVGINTAAAAAESIGKYAATVWFTNVTSGAIQELPFSYQSTPLVINGGFEYGSAAFWTETGNTGDSMVGNNGQGSAEGEFVHSGFYGAILGDNGSMGYLSQTIPTVAGRRYALSFWLDSYADNDTNEFVATWNGTTILDLTNRGNFAYSNFQFTVVADATNSVLQFGFNQDTNYISIYYEGTNFFGLDDVSLTALYPPAIAVGPTNETVTLPGPAVFTVQAGGTPPLSYQWYFNGTVLDGATNTALTLANLTTNQSGYYTVTVSNAYGTNASPPALLTVLLPGPPNITGEPASQSVTQTGAVTFTVQATGVGALSYQWQFNGALLAATNSTLLLTGIATNQGGYYTVTVSDPYGSTNSVPALLTVFPTSPLRNGGFETGDFSGWTLEGNTNFSAVVEGAPYAHSGNYGLQSGPFGSPLVLSQTFTTAPGQTYLVSCWVNDPEGGAPNELQMTWSGTNLASVINLGAANWTNIQAIAIAAGPSATLSFTIQDDPAYLGLDDVSVSLLPQPSFLTSKASAGHFAFQWSALAGLDYQVQYTSDLASGSWTNLGGAIVASNIVATATDTLTNSQRFYRVVLVP